MPSPQQVNWAKFRASSVILAGLLILGTLALLLTGGTFMHALSVGTHTITAKATDSGGLIGSTTATVTVAAPVTLMFTPTADAYVNAGSVSTNTGTAKILRVDSWSATNYRRDQRHEPTHLNAGGEIKYKGGADMMQRLDLAQFQQRLHAIELLLDDIEQGKDRWASSSGESLYNDLRTRWRICSAVSTWRRTRRPPWASAVHR
jgi:hypothetical protein